MTLIAIDPEPDVYAREAFVLTRQKLGIGTALFSIPGARLPFSLPTSSVWRFWLLEKRQRLIAHNSSEGVFVIYLPSEAYVCTRTHYCEVLVEDERLEFWCDNYYYQGVTDAWRIRVDGERADLTTIVEHNGGWRISRVADDFVALESAKF